MRIVFVASIIMCKSKSKMLSRGGVLYDIWMMVNYGFLCSVKTKARGSVGC